ncbi:laccase-4-like [Magnolia sinica]|uniref:laccase-4-like n=1 Tax=Magnolia sinica TaxID=86752 RepID=UPI002659488F|nr:laccase-4-like [Magnolia sinica]
MHIKTYRYIHSVRERERERDTHMESWVRTVVLVSCLLLPTVVECKVRHYKFNVVLRNKTRLCQTKPIVTVNGRFPGPTLYAREGDNVIVKVTNHVKYNVTIHWHGVRQLQTGWFDGPAYITQCPIQTGQSYVYNFTITGQRGTLLWHAHVLWLRATVHGAIVILPKLGVPYPFPKPDKEEIIILGEWWTSDVEAVINTAMAAGQAPNVSDAHTINGHPGPLSNCSQQGGYKLQVEPSKTYLLRIINAALNEELFFKVAGHSLTVVEVDAVYVKPFKIDTILITPGQTTNVLLTANQSLGRYLITASPFMDTPIVAVDNMTGTATVHYSGTLATSATTLTTPPPQNATPVANNFILALRSLNSKAFPANVPLTIDHSLFFTAGMGVNPCSTCVNGSRAVAAMNNVSFVMPTTAILQAHYFNISGVYTTDFPGNPLITFNYTGTLPTNLQTLNGTRVYKLAYNSTVQLVLQDTGFIAPENHPIHLHGFNFFGVGRGVGNFNATTDPANFNLVDPVERNTIGVPSGGWTAIRFRADNPGVWFLHCHLEVHTTWGLKMAFLVDNGKGPKESLIPPPSDLPTC